MKPHFACDAELDLIVYPVAVFPKLDGVRGVNLDGTFTGRSLKKHKNVALTEFFSRAEFSGFDGELTVGDPLDGACCRRTSSACSTIAGPGGSDFVWNLFDDLTHPDQPFILRYSSLKNRLYRLRDKQLRLVPYIVAVNETELLDAHQQHMAEGYEGTIVRGLYSMHKDGRARPRENGFLRIKDFIEEEAYVYAIEEGEENQNVATTNELGYTERSSHKENKVPNGMVGRLLCLDLKTRQKITVAPGRLSHDERRRILLQPSLIVGKYVKYKRMAYGQKDKPRFPTFQTIRDSVDIDPELLIRDLSTYGLS